MPQRGGGETYAERFRQENLGRTVHPPVDGPTRAGADALPSRSLGGLPPMWNLFNPHIGMARSPGSTYWEDQAYRMAMLADSSRPRGYPGPEMGGLAQSPVAGMPSPGIGMGTPAPFTFEDQSMGYPGAENDPLLYLLQVLLNNRFPNGDQ